MRAAFIPALPPSALLAGMIAPSFRLVNRFCGKKLLRTCGRRERPHALCAVWARSPLAYVLLRTCGRHARPPALCAVWAWSPLACGRVPYPPYARYGMGRLCGERRRRERFERPCGARNAPRRTPRLSPPGHAPPHRPTKAPLRVSVSSGTRETRLAAPPRLLRRASRPHQPSEVWRAAALQVEFRIQRHARWIRQPCASKATLRRPPPGEPAAKPPAK